MELTLSEKTGVATIMCILSSCPIDRQRVIVAQLAEEVEKLSSRPVKVVYPNITRAVRHHLSQFGLSDEEIDEIGVGAGHTVTATRD